MTPEGYRWRTRPLPLPEAIDRGEWAIEQAPGDGRQSSVAFDSQAESGGTLRVPLAGGERERYIRAHELGHIAWTPRGPFPAHLPEAIMQHAEDARIARRLAALGMPARVRLLADEEIAQTAAGLVTGTHARIDVASMLLATVGMPDGQELAAAVARVEPTLPGRVEQVWADTIGREEKPDFRRAVEAAELLARLFGEPGGPQRTLPGLGGRVGRGAQEGAQGGGSPPTVDAKSELDWGGLRIVEFPRPLRLAPRVAGARWRASQEGTRLGDPSRFYRDGRGWRERRQQRHAGGTVLIDCSASMSLSPEALEGLVAANPAALIATYSGDENRQSGRLHIVARGARRVRAQHLRPPGLYNVCDGPALEWLGRQRPPRIWVSDGGVTGRGEVRTPALLADAAAIADRHRIRRVETADALLGEWREAGELPL